MWDKLRELLSRDAGADAGTDGKARARPDYARQQLLRALAAAEAHPDATVRERATARAREWLQTLEGMLTGTIDVGSRIPILGTPAWVTPRVLLGGFASGGALAGGDLQPHEHALLARHGLDATGGRRSALNTFFLSDDGLAALQAMRRSREYRIDVPEEGALLVAAWLVERQDTSSALALLGEIAPWFDRLRFYPVPSAARPSTRPLVHRQPVGKTIAQLLTAGESPERLARREALAVWAPMFDRLATLFLETVDGPPPSIAVAGDGKPLRNRGGSWTLSGGWPCQRYPDGWRERALAWLAECGDLRKTHRRCREPERARGNFALLRQALARCAGDPAVLTGREVGRVRMILAQVIARRGPIDAPRCRDLRASQAREAALPTPRELRLLMAGRLKSLPPDQGLDALDAPLAPVTAEESAQHRVQAGYADFGRLAPIVMRSLDAPLDTLIERRVITSSEMMAAVLPQLTSHVMAEGFEDDDLRALYAAIHQAFRRRRSVLLLNLEKQVRIEELPWVSALERCRKDSDATRAAAHAMLQRVVRLAITTFPFAIVPNRLVSDLRSLFDRAGIALPLVEEVAADIFMFEFTEKFLRAAQLAGRMLAGSLYERYYDISYAAIAQIDDVAKRESHKPPTSAGFADLCRRRAGMAGSDWSPAVGGAIIEQQQILTTQNLAVLIEGLGLRPEIAERAPELARACFTWICEQHRVHHADWRPELHAIKNSAYAWRQMLFFLSLVPRAAVEDFAPWAESQLSAHRTDFKDRFRPAMAGLAIAARGESLSGVDPAQARRFLGWGLGRHWLRRGE